MKIIAIILLCASTCYADPHEWAGSGSFGPVTTELYTAYFQNNFGCADSGTVYTCADPNAFTSETDTASLGAINSNAFVSTYSNTTGSVTLIKSGFSSHSDTSTRFRFSTNNVNIISNTSITLATLRDATFSQFAVSVVSSGVGQPINQWKVNYWNGANTNTPATYSYSFSNNTVYDIELHTVYSTSGSGSYKLIVNGATVANVTGLTIHDATSDRLYLATSGASSTGIITLDNVWLGYK